MTSRHDRKPNALIHESSPYLLQHAYNPVQWLPYSADAFERARRENKPLLISVGYSACHWCHVMERESFEDDRVAEVMNARFINIKVDREERADVDMVYMEAVQLMTGQGGWPLNCFVLPDGRPFYGGTYFRKDDWVRVLESLSDLFSNDPAKVNEYADALTDGIRRAESFITTQAGSGRADVELLSSSVGRWKKNLDRKFGGPDRAPKFPLPSNYRFLLRYARMEKDEELMRHVETTLTHMAFGGIYDHVHGGFARYSTDAIWKVPHFEKMLYDNAQLAQLYTEAWTCTKNPLYREVAVETLAFMEREWFRGPGLFYSAYDADSEGEEGKYYVWTEDELRHILAHDFPLFADYYHVDRAGYWEHDNYILMRNHDQAGVLLKHGVNAVQAKEAIDRCRGKLREAARSRVKPGLDDKSITAWNALACSAFANAWLVFGEERYRQIALRSVAFITGELSRGNNRLFRSYKNGTARIAGFLDDYAFTIRALIDCYLAAQDEKYIALAVALCESTLTNFENPDSALLYYTGTDSEKLVARTTETSDNVIPASNSQMALNLYYLGVVTGREDWVGRARKMLEQVSPELAQYGAGYSHWCMLAMHFAYPSYEVAIVGNSVDEMARAFLSHGTVNAILAVSRGPSQLALLLNRYQEGKTLFYVCRDRACKLPVGSAEEAIAGIE